MKKTPTLICAILLFTLLVQPIKAQTFHAVVFAATETENKELAAGIQVSYDHLKQLLSSLESAGLDVQTHYHDGANFNIDRLAQAISSLKTSKNDYILFYFIGHGFEDTESSYPNLIFTNKEAISNAEKEQNARNEKEIHETLQKKKFKGLLVVADACNSELNTTGWIKQGKSSKKSDPTPESKAFDRINWTACANILQSEEFQYLIASSQTGKDSYTHPEKGGIFTIAFVNAFKTACDDNIDSLDHIIRLIPSEINKLTAPIEDLEQIPLIFSPIKEKQGFLQQLANIFFSRKEKKELKKAFNVEELGNLKATLQLTEDYPESRRKFLKTKPAAYYTIMAISNESELYVARTLQDTIRVSLDYCTASIIHLENRSTRDIDIIQKIRKLDRKHQLLGIPQKGPFGKWLDYKCTEYTQYLNDQREEIEVKEKELEEILVEVESELDDKREERRGLQNDIDVLTKRLSEIDESINTTKRTITENGTLRISIPTLPDNISPKLNQALDALVAGKQLPSGLTAKEKYWLSQIDIKLEPNDKLEPNALLTSELKDFQIAKYCTPKIQGVSQKIMSLLLQQLSVVPEAYKDSINIKFKIEGYADYRGRKSALGIGFPTKNKSYDYQYKNDLGQIKTFKHRKHTYVNLTNETLALSRAICAYEECLDIMDNHGIRHHEVELFAIEQDLSKSAKSDDKMFRGVNVFFTLEDVNLYLLKHIDLLEKERKEIQDAIIAKEEAIRGINRQIEDLNVKVIEVTNEQEQLEERKIELETGIDDVRTGLGGQPNAIRARQAEIQKIQDAKE